MRVAHGLVLLVPAVLAGGWLLAGSPAPDAVSGRVKDDHGPAAGARVRFQGKCPAATTDREGHFRLPAAAHAGRRVTAWKQGYAITASPADRRPLALTLTRLPAVDHEDYSWIDPRPDPHGASNCGNCHEAIYREWSASAHAHAATGRRLRSLLEGEDWHGRPSPAWSLATEHPLGAAVCATCHAPTYRDPTLAYELGKARGVDALGVHCDYCHKIADAPTDRLGTRFGRDGLRLLRPAGGDLLFFGPLDDAYRPGESFAYSALYRESRYCASCHEGVIFGVHAYGTYSEWLQSPARGQGRQCQDCHMAASGKLTNIAPGKGGVERDPKTLASHALPGGQIELLRRGLRLALQVRRAEGGVRAEVEVQADNVGHRVPTGFIDRNVLLVVQALDRAGRAVTLTKGPRLPGAAGKALAGQPGRLYARRLTGADGRSPIPFWLPPAAATDTRLLPGRPDRRQFHFGPGAERVRARLLYRRFWQEVAQAKGWPDNEITVADQTLAAP
jgi:hypothetical protein